MFCKKCGNQMEEGVAFCKKCGTPVENAPKVIKGKMPVNRQYIKIGIIAASIVMIVATMLPFLVMDAQIARYTGMESISLLKPGDQIGDGVIYIIIAVLIIVFVCLEKKIPLLICGIFPPVMYFYEAREVEKAYGTLLGSGLDMYDYITKGSGYHLILISSMLVCALCVFYFIMHKKGIGNKR